MSHPSGGRALATRLAACGIEFVDLTFGAQRQATGWELWVRDDGIGLEPAYADRIFQIFQRLHTRAEYPGTGIGLAICKRIVEQHGGTLRLESAPGAGATFFFTVPDRRRVWAT